MCQSVVMDIDSVEQDMDNGHNSAGTPPPPPTHGQVLDDGIDSGNIVVHNPITPKKQLSTGERTKRAMALKLAGASYASIADTLGYSDASGARKAVMRGMDQSLQENANELRKLHYGRLEHMLMLLWSDVNTKSLPSMSAALAIMDRMAKLHGIDSSLPSEVNIGQQTVILADGSKEDYIKALTEAGLKMENDITEAKLIKDE